MTFYFIQYNILDSFVSQVLRGLQGHIKKHDEIFLKNIYPVVLHLRNAVDDFNEIMSIFPFIWLSTAFFSGTTIVFKSKTIQITSICDVLKWYLVPIIMNSFMFVTVWLMDNKHYYRQKEIANITDLLGMKETDCDTKLYISTISALESLGNKKMSALRFVELDRQLLLTFTSAFVTFTVLFSSLVD